MANTFVVGDIVKTLPGLPGTIRNGGVIRYIACVAATSAGGKTCDKKTCQHPVKQIVWVQWQGHVNIFSYMYTELTLNSAPSSIGVSGAYNGYLGGSGASGPAMPKIIKITGVVGPTGPASPSLTKTTAPTKDFVEGVTGPLAVDKDAYIEKAKKAIDDVVKTKSEPKESVSDFFKAYNGFTKVKRDRNGRPYIQESFEQKPAIKDDEIDWDVYHGLVKGPLKKSSSQ